MSTEQNPQYRTPSVWIGSVVYGGYCDIMVHEQIPDEWDPCPQCGENLIPGSVRWNGTKWEHKSKEAHPQAGHHIMDPDY